MDNRLQNIVEHFDEIKIGVDEPFQFHCTQCGKCCVNREDILLNPKDLYNLAKELNLSPEEVINRYGESYIGDSSRIPIVRLKPQGSIKRCPLLKDRRCSVHKSKPTVCAMFPVGRCLKIDGADCSSDKIQECQVEYILNDPGCGDGKETHTVRKWFEAFGIPLEDDFFKRWHQTVLEIGTVIRKAEKIYGESLLNKIWTLIYVLLYLSYNTAEDFLPQYISNAEKAVWIIGMMPLQ
ncbi:YkgJ family cysteine cluster protein [Lacrimispora amygdalina]|uniref:YkgJ family cysteine cluster protein n=1 Tax=Lacrimispora amygdalina TaxID=253257 RepID=A0A3E2N549_9FIRM|nr:YkgJ family cysteine cluster protein [Clostridium indicum]RFZ76102.1 YkgJ family cysteine cluster protein [Clostridium indicum]